jgi:hypothetical protein
VDPKGLILTIPDVCLKNPTLEGLFSLSFYTTY